MFDRRRARFATNVAALMGGAAAAAAPADYIVTNDGQWTTAVAAAAAAGSSKIIEVSGSNFTRVALTGDFTGKPLTIRGANGSAELPLGMNFAKPLIGVTIKNIKISRPQEAEGWFVGALANTVYGVITHSSSGLLDEIHFDTVIVDGGARPLRDGGWLTTDTSFGLRRASNFTIRNSTFKNVFSGIVLNGCSDGIIENNTVQDRHADGINTLDLDGDCVDIDILNNHFVGLGGGFRYHMDVWQPQPTSSNGNVQKNIRVSGNTSSVGAGPWMAQCDPAVAFSVISKTNDFTVDTSMHCNEIQCNPSVDGTIVATLPAASDGKYQYCFRQTGAGTVSFALNGADTYSGGTPSLSANGTAATFVSDGVSQWRKLRSGFMCWVIEVRSNRTLSAVEVNHVVAIDATDGNVTVTLPSGGSGPYAIQRIDTSANTVTLARGGSDTITLHSAGLTSVSFPFGYSIDITGAAGVWTATEDTVGTQVYFANEDNGDAYENIEIDGNISVALTATGCRFEVEATANPALNGFNVHNNTFLIWLADDMNADGAISGFEGNNLSRAGDIYLPGESARGWSNFTTGSLITAEGALLTGTTVDGNGIDIGSVALGIADKTLMLATLDDYFNGTTKAAYRPSTRAEVITAALAKSGGALDATYIGACGTTSSNGYYNFVTGAVNTVTLAPTVTLSNPADNSTAAADGNIVLTLSQFLTAGTGVFTLRNVTDNTTIETFNIATTVGSAGGSIVIVNNVITINPFANTPNGKVVSLQWAAGVVLGQYGTPIAANATDTALNWTVDAGLPSDFTAVTVAGALLTKSGLTGWASGNRTKLLFAANVVRGASSDALASIIQVDGTRDFAVSIDSAGIVRVTVGANSFRVPGGAPTSGARETIIMSVDLAQATLAAGVKYYRNGVDIDPSTFTNTSWAGASDVTTPTTVNLLDIVATTQTLFGTVGMVYFDTPGSLPDIDSSTIRAHFDPGEIIPAAGNTPSGAQPLIFIHGNAAFWLNSSANNLGSGGFFTATGTIT